MCMWISVSIFADYMIGYGPICIEWNGQCFRPSVSLLYIKLLPMLIERGLTVQTLRRALFIAVNICVYPCICVNICAYQCISKLLPNMIQWETERKTRLFKARSLLNHTRQRADTLTTSLELLWRSLCSFGTYFWNMFKSVYICLYLCICVCVRAFTVHIPNQCVSDPYLSQYGFWGTADVQRRRIPADSHGYIRYSQIWADMCR